MADRRVARHDDPVDPVTGERRWPEWHDDTLHALDRLNRSLQRRWLLVVVALLVVGFFAFKTAFDQGRTADQARDAARSAQRSAAAIQHSRYQSFYDECRTTDGRHDATIRRLRHLPRLGGVSRTVRRHQIASTIVLIDAFLPKVKDCKRFAAVHVTLPATPIPPER